MIKSATIQGIRGISRKTEIDFTNSGKICTTIIFGENGSGKSSIIDSIEFALQGKIRPIRPWNNRNGHRLISQSSKTPVWFAECYTGNETLRRDIIKDVDGQLIYDSSPFSAYALAPVVLRRADIQRFWDYEEFKRQVFLMEYFNPAASNEEFVPSDVRVVETSEKVKLAQADRDLAIDKLAKALKVGISEIPTEANQFSTYLNERFYWGTTAKDRNRDKLRGIIHNFPNRPTKQINEVKLAMGLVNEARREKKKALANTIHISPKKRGITETAKRTSQIASNLFKEISPARGLIKEIHINLGTESEAKLNVSLELLSGTHVEPKDFLSEANLDLLALLVLLAMIKESGERGQGKFVIFDDVFQSVDASIRLDAIAVITRELKDWQIIYSTHDRLWKELLRNALVRSGQVCKEISVVSWSFYDGPCLRSTTFESTASPLISALTTGDVRIITYESGYLLEKTCDYLSCNLGASIVRRRNDRYTLGELWDSVKGILKRLNGFDIIDELDKILILRNLSGAHFNEWAESLSTHEAESFGKLVVKFLNMTFCTTCNRYLEVATLENRKIVKAQCRCGILDYQLKPQGK